MSYSSVLVYLNYLLPASETFVRAQAEALQNFVPYYIGLRIDGELPLPSERTLVVNTRSGLLAKINRIRTKLGGFTPSFVQRIKTLNPLLIHAHFGENGAIALHLARDLQIPLIVTIHGNDILRGPELYLDSIVYFSRKPLLKRKVQLFIAVSKFVREKLLAQGFPSNRIQVHYTGVDTTWFNTDPAKPRQPVVLFVGRLVEMKGCEYLIRAMARVQSELPHIKLVVIGDGPLRPLLEHLAKQCLQQYSFLGVQPPEVVREWIQEAQVFCVPSVTTSSGDAETFGMVFAESQAMGLPVVSSASGGISEAVAHGETGFLAPERDSVALASYILQLLQDQILWHRFSQNGRERVQALFNLNKQNRALEEIYRNIAIAKDGVMNSK